MIRRRELTADARFVARVELTDGRVINVSASATGRSERAVVEEAVARYLANPTRDPAAAGALDRLTEAIAEDRRVRERQHRDVEILSEAFGRFLRVWTFVHGATFVQPTSPEAAQAVSRQRASGDDLFRRFTMAVADQFQRGHRFVQDLPGLGGSQPRSDGKP